MANTLKFGNKNWATKDGSILAYNSENNNYKPLPFNFERASTATVVGKDGLIKTVGANEPRVDYLNDSNGALLLEPQRANKLPYSLDYDNDTFFDKINSTITKESGIAPDGSNSAYKLKDTDDTSNTSHYFKQTNGYKAFIDYDAIKSASVFIKAGTKKQVQVRLSNAAGTFSYVMGNFDLETETILTGASFNAENVAYDLQNYGNGWYRCIVIGSWTESNVSHSRIEVFTADTSLASLPNIHNYQGNGSGTLFVWGEMIEEGSYATSLINTNGSAVTRLADVCNNGGNEQVINSTEGVLYAEINIPENIADNINISINDGTNDEYVKFLYLASTNTFRAQIQGSGNQVGVNTTSLVLGSYSKLAVSYKSGEFKLYINGSQIGSTLTGHTLPTGLDTLSFDRGDGAAPFQGNVKDVRVYDTALTDQELINLTKI